MNLLLDSNVFLEVILERDKADEARALLGNMEAHEFFVSDFSLHSIGIFFCRRKQNDVFRGFLRDIVMGIGVIEASLSAEDLESVVDEADKYNLDFDDAYQYAAAKKHNLTLVSFDSDFDRTDRGRLSPGDVLA